jgi:disulfide bond formation protein DsbB
MNINDALQWHRAHPRSAVLVHVAITVFMLGFALISQYVFGHAPCVLCQWQRVPYALIALLALASLLFKPRWTPLLLAGFATLYMAEAGIAFFHIGVQASWWEGTRGCGLQNTASDIKALYAQIKNAPLARCTDVTWRFMGFSMAAWNFVLALGLVAFSLLQAWVQRVWWTNKTPR